MKAFMYGVFHKKIYYVLLQRTIYLSYNRNRSNCEEVQTSLFYHRGYTLLQSGFHRVSLLGSS